jgi:CHAT domain-containing protein
MCQESFKKAGNLSSAAICLLKIGQINRMRGQWEKAVARCAEALPLAQEAHDAGSEARVLVGMAQAEASHNNLDAAMANAQKAVALCAAHDDMMDLFNALDVLAQVQTSQGRTTEAVESITRAFSLLSLLPDKSQSFYAYFDRADIYVKIAESCDYQPAFDVCLAAVDCAKADYVDALAVARGMGWDHLAHEVEGFQRRVDSRGALIESQRRAHVIIAGAGIFHPWDATDVVVSERFALQPSDVKPQEASFYKTLATSWESGGGTRGASVMAIPLYVEGLLAQGGGSHDAALSAFLRAVSALERDRRSLRDETSRGSYFEDKIGIYYAAILELLDRGRLPEAFDLTERSRARSMADLLATRSIDLSGEAERSHYAAWTTLRARIARKQSDLFGLVCNKASQKKIDAVDAEIASLERDYNLLEARIAAETPRLQQLAMSRPVTLSQLQALAKREKFDVLEYLVLDHAVILWHIGAGATHVRNIFLPRAEAAEKVAALQSCLSTKPPQGGAIDQAQARELFLYLVQPALRWVTTKRLVVIPHDALHALSFQALQNPDDGQYLGETFAISYAPSATVLASLEPVQPLEGSTIVAIADPGIATARNEASAIARLFPGKSTVRSDSLARKSEVKNAIRGYDVVHLSVHGVFRPSAPLLSSLSFAADNQDDGMLSAAEMFGLPLEQTKLVVLSACETARAGTTTGNDVIGMMQALLFAGAKSLILSSWKVDAASTTLWMETFYKEARSQPLAEAARLALLSVKSIPAFSHPYYWAPYVLVGR